jgi:tetratricopeptide (TPR) repeat protein
MDSIAELVLINNQGGSAALRRTALPAPRSGLGGPARTGAPIRCSEPIVQVAHPRSPSVRRRPEPVESASRRCAMACGHSRLNPAESRRFLAAIGEEPDKDALGILGTECWHDPGAARLGGLQVPDDDQLPQLDPKELYDLAWTCLHHGDNDGARQAFERVIDTGHPVWASSSGDDLAWMLLEAGDRDGAREHYQRVVQSGPNGRAEGALSSLIGLLRDDDDLDGLRALYDTALATSNSSAPDVMEAIGRLLEKRGDTAGARHALQQAIDAGHYYADDLIEELHPTPEPTAAELDALAPQFDPRNLAATGIEVLSDGLPALPDQLSYLMAIPVAYWTATHCGAVLFLRFRPRGRTHDAHLNVLAFSRADTGWARSDPSAGGTAFVTMTAGRGHDPIASSGSWPDMRGTTMFASGRTYARPAIPGLPVLMLHGHAAPAVKNLALIQDGRVEVRPLQSHFGAWLICTEQDSPLQVEGRDADGTTLARISHPDDEPEWPAYDEGDS